MRSHATPYRSVPSVWPIGTPASTPVPAGPASIREEELPQPSSSVMRKNRERLIHRTVGLQRILVNRAPIRGANRDGRERIRRWRGSIRANDTVPRLVSTLRREHDDPRSRTGSCSQWSDATRFTRRARRDMTSLRGFAVSNRGTRSYFTPSQARRQRPPHARSDTNARWPCARAFEGRGRVEVEAIVRGDELGGTDSTDSAPNTPSSSILIDVSQVLVGLSRRTLRTTVRA